MVIMQIIIKHIWCKQQYAGVVDEYAADHDVMTNAQKSYYPPVNHHASHFYKYPISRP